MMQTDRPTMDRFILDVSPVAEVEGLCEVRVEGGRNVTQRCARITAPKRTDEQNEQAGRERQA